RFLLFVGAPFQIAKTDVLCNGGNDGQAIAMGTGSPPWDYTWKDGQNTVLQTTNASYGADTLSGLIAGVYSVEISGGGGHCNAVSDTFSIAEPAWINLSLSTGNVLCHAGVDGSVTANAGGGMPPYLYQWSNGETTAAIAGLSAGIYSLTMTDANGCSTTEQALVEEPAELQITTQVTDASQSNCDGMAIASCTGGTGSYSFLWDGNAGNQASAAADSLCPGTYYVTVTDQNGCTAIDSAIVVITGLVELNEHGDASVYPNPAGDRCYVQLSGMEEGAILLYDLLGQEVLRSGFVNGAHSEHASLDVSALDEGIYYLVIRGDEIVKSARISVIHQRKVD
ncbi:MAG: T9SS type A sorting domain-containing protein, partial [Flavobacteriales bacterium]